MAATNDTYLPTYEELHVPPLNLTSAALKAGSLYFGKYCDKQSMDFMLCKNEEKDPRKCLKYNKEVGLCANEFFGKVKSNCAESFTDYWKCLDNAPIGQMSYKFCRKTQAEFDKCMTERLNMQRPEVGWASKPRLYDPKDRPKPVETTKDYEKIQRPDVKTLPQAEANDSLAKTGRRAY